jgi:large subunit ribosomal protein L10
MATSRSKKEEQLAALQAKFEAATGIAFTQFEGPTVNEVQDIRRSLRDQGMSYTVIKKTLISIAAKNAGKAEFTPRDLEGNVAVIVSETDEVSPAAAIKKLRKDFFDKETDTSKYDFAGAVFDGKFLDKAATATLANTPSREESLGRIVGMLKSGPQKLHGILNSGLQKPYNVLQNAEKFAKAE